MDYAQLESLRQNHPAWRLLRIRHAPLMLSFLSDSFIKANRRALDEPTLAAKLDDYLYQLRQSFGEQAFAASAAFYLEHWADGKNAWLRKYYPSGQDIACVELTAATEKAIEWLESLQKREFVGTESRLLTIFSLLRQVAKGSDSDPQTRLIELRKRRAELDTEIARAEAGEVELLDETKIKERFLEVTRTARSLLADFREVEQNFRDLSRKVRERIATWDGSKSELLQQIFGNTDAIRDSDQGRSFRAFWEFLMSPARQEELSQLLHKAFALEAVQALQPDPRLKRMHHDWLDASGSVQRTLAGLSEQLRRYLDDKALLENRRIMQILQRIEKQALRLRDSPPEAERFSELPGTRAALNLPLARPLWRWVEKPAISAQILSEGKADGAGDALFDYSPVDRARLQQTLQQALRSQSRISLGELLQAFPLQQGLAELVSWLELAAQRPNTVFDESQTERIALNVAEKHSRHASIPLILLCKAP